jgi:hypothetical protein
MEDKQNWALHLVNGIKEDNLTVKLNMDDMSKILREYPSLMKDSHKDE